jgi:hypothetical protein
MCLTRRQRGTRDHLQRVSTHRFFNCVRRSADGDLELLTPQTRLLALNLFVQNVVFVGQLQALLTELEQDAGEGERREDAQEQLEHVRLSLGDSDRFAWQAEFHVGVDDVAVFQHLFVQLKDGGDGVGGAELFDGDFGQGIAAPHGVGVLRRGWKVRCGCRSCG